MNKRGNLQVFGSAIPNHKSFLTNFAEYAKHLTDI